MASKTKLDIIFGAMTLGQEDKRGVRTSKLADCGAILDILKSHGHTEIDTSRVYAEGTSEEYLGMLKWQDRGLVSITLLWIRNTARDCPNLALEGMLGSSSE